ncbi:MAG: NmrA family NAD(P)-binding protein, partial [Mucilaginibacter sp.]
MKITLTGSTGNITKPLAQILIGAGHQVTIISSDAAKTEIIAALGATAAIGSVNDTGFLARAFTGADAVYIMIPPNYGAPDLRKFMNEVGQSYAAAIKTAGVKRAVVLSSVGAHRSDGTGPITGLHDLEQTLNTLEDVAVKYIRAPFFYINLYANVDMIKHAGIIGSNYPADARLVMGHPRDIAIVIGEEIQKPFTGKTVRYVASDERTTAEVAKVLGAAIGKPGLPWVEFTDEQAFEGMAQAGLPEEMAKKYTEMGTAVKSGILWEDYDLHKPQLSA